jgi:hypothetical protein
VTRGRTFFGRDRRFLDLFRSCDRILTKSLAFESPRSDRHSYILPAGPGLDTLGVGVWLGVSRGRIGARILIERRLARGRAEVIQTSVVERRERRAHSSCDVGSIYPPAEAHASAGSGATAAAAAAPRTGAITRTTADKPGSGARAPTHASLPFGARSPALRGRSDRLSTRVRTGPPAVLSPTYALRARPPGAGGRPLHQRPALGRCGLRWSPSREAVSSAASPRLSSGWWRCACRTSDRLLSFRGSPRYGDCRFPWPDRRLVAPVSILVRHGDLQSPGPTHRSRSSGGGA